MKTGEVVSNDVMADQDLTIFEPLDTTGDRLSVTFIVVNNRLTSLLLVNNKAVDFGNIIQEAVAF